MLSILHSDIENGKRNVALDDLYQFCEFFKRPIDYFLKEKLLKESGFKVLFRKNEGDRELAEVITEFENLCEKMCELEEIMENEIKPPISEDYKYKKNKLLLWGKHYASLERKKLDLGQAPIRNLAQMLEEKCGLKIFYLPIPEERRVFGIFTFDENIGGCILINANSTAGNQLFSLAHEYGHFVFHKDRLGIISFQKEEDTSDERLANYFASNFLMPDEAVNDMFNVRIKNRKDITAEDIIYLADYFGVSFQAMVFKLNNLKLVNDDKKEKLITDTWVGGLRKAMNISEPERGRTKFPSLYLHLCIKAYQEDRITTAKLADFLELPLYQAMKLGGEIKRSIRDGESNPF